MTPLYQPLVWLLAATGLRWGEATALQWRDIGDDQITVRQAWKHDGDANKRVIGTAEDATGPAPYRDHEGRHRVPRQARRLRRVRVHQQPWRSDRVPHVPSLPLGARLHCRETRPRPAHPRTPTLRGFVHARPGHGHLGGVPSPLFGHSDISTTTGVYGHLAPSKTRPTAIHAARLERTAREAARGLT